MESAWFAALNMLDKRAGFRYIPHRYLNINDKPIHYVGEIGGTFSEYHIDGDPRSDKFIIWFFKGEEIVSFLTVGYKNVHLYLWEAMQQLLMPPAHEIRIGRLNFENIVQRVMIAREDIRCLRKEQSTIQSVMRAEFTREREKLEEFRGKLKKNVEVEKSKQR